MSSPRYDGNTVVVHTVKSGETLSRIAASYGFKSWKPIWLYNTKVHANLGASADRIRAGQKILIPRSQKGYDRLIEKLRSLKDMAAAGNDSIKHQLEGELNRHKGARVMFDFAGDVLTLVATSAQKVYSYASRYKMAANTGGEAGVRIFESALKEQHALQAELGKKLKDTAIKKGLGVVDPDLETAYDDLYLKQKKGIEAILKSGTSMLDVADLLLDCASVSNVADTLIAISATEVVFDDKGLRIEAGETPMDTYNRAQAQLRRSNERTRNMLDQKIAKHRQEKALIYVA